MDAHITSEPATALPAAPVLTVVLPAFNEARTIDTILQRVLASTYHPEVIVVNDASTDATAEVLAKWSGHPQVRLLTHAVNQGKGSAIRTGLTAATGEFCIIQDADLEYDPADYPVLIEPLRQRTATAVFGSRYSQRFREEWRLFRHGVRVLNWVVRGLYGQTLTDEATCYKALPTALYRVLDLQCTRFEFCPEVTAKLCRLGVRIHEVPISYAPRSTSEGKKIRLRDGWQAIQELWRWRRWKPSVEASEFVKQWPTTTKAASLPAASPVVVLS